MALSKEEKAAAARARAANPEHRALVDALKAAGKLDQGHRYEWELPKALRPNRGRKSKRGDKQALADLRDSDSGDIEPAYTVGDAPVDAAGLLTVPEDTNYELPVAGETAGEAHTGGGVGGAAVGGDAVADIFDGDPDSIAGHKAELKRLAALKRSVTDEYMALPVADKDTIAFYDKKLKLIESQEKAAMDQLKLFNKKRLDAESAANQVLIIIEPWQGDGTSSVKTWL